MLLHPGQVMDSRDAPQFEQNFPVPVVEHAAQTTSEVEGSIMRYNLAGRTEVRRRSKCGARDTGAAHGEKNICRCC